MVLAMRSPRLTQQITVLIVLSMLLGAFPAQLAFAVATAGGSNDGDGSASEDDRGVLPSTETFTSTFYNSLDSDNNSKRDAIRARYTAVSYTHLTLPTTPYV